MSQGSPHPGTEPTFLVWLTRVERDIIRAIRADPLQHQHVVEYDLVEETCVVQHPITERVAGTMLGCSVLADAHRFAQDEALPSGRYRWIDDVLVRLS